MYNIERICFYSEKDFIIEDGVKYVGYDGSYYGDDGKEVEVSEGKVSLEFAEKRAIKELNDFFKGCKNFEDVVNAIDEYKDDTVYKYDNNNIARIYLGWCIIMYNKELESVYWDIRAY